MQRTSLISPVTPGGVSVDEMGRNGKRDWTGRGDDVGVTLHHLNTYITNTIFPKMKFYFKDDVMADFNLHEENSLCYKVSEHVVLWCMGGRYC